MSLHVILLEMKKLLGNLDGFIEKALAHATARKYDPSVLLQTRLAPDMLPLVFQIRATCDQAKYAAARTTGKEVPSHPDTEQTFDELRKRIANVVSYLDGFTPADFAGADTCSVTTPRWEGKTMSGTDYFVEHAMPNFFFHLTSAYAILRSCGVELGKKDYLGKLPFR